MKISREEVTQVARLARLEIDESAVDTYARQLGKILEYMEALNRVDTSSVPATSHAISLNNAFREDEVADHLETDTALANAPEKESGAFLVPKVVG